MPSVEINVMTSSSMSCVAPSRSVIATRTVRGLSSDSTLLAFPLLSKSVNASAFSEAADVASTTAVSIREISLLLKLAVTVPAPRVLPNSRVKSATPAAFVRLLPLVGRTVAMSLVRLIIRDSMVAVAEVELSVTRAVSIASGESSVLGFPAASRSSSVSPNPPIFSLVA